MILNTLYTLLPCYLFFYQTFKNIYYYSFIIYIMNNYLFI